MYADNAVIHNHKEVISFEHFEKPVVAQLGGNDPDLLTKAAKICVDYGYHEINLNVSCLTTACVTKHLDAHLY